MKRFLFDLLAILRLILAIAGVLSLFVAWQDCPTDALLALAYVGAGLLCWLVSATMWAADELRLLRHQLGPEKGRKS